MANMIIKQKQLKHFAIEIIAVLIGGFIGCNFRYFLSVWIHPQFLSYQNMHDFFKFPFAIFVINILGSFLIGFLQILLLEIKKREHKVSMYFWEPLILVGLLGGFTTVSSFILDSINLFNAGFYMVALFNILVSIISGFIFCLFGVYLGEKVVLK